MTLQIENQHTKAESNTLPGRSDLENLCINTIRFLAVDAAENADSGHPILPMGAARRDDKPVRASDLFRNQWNQS